MILIHKYQVLGILKGHMLYIMVIYESYRKGLVSFINQQVLGIRYFPRSCAPYNCHHIHSLLHKSTSIRYQVFSKAICFVSLAYMSHPEIILIHKYQVLGIFKGHMLYIIIIHESSQNGLVFFILVHVLGLFKDHMPHIIIIFSKAIGFISLAYMSLEPS